MTDMAETRVDAEDVDNPTPPPSARRIRLETVDQVRVEMARVYREVRARKLAPDVASKLFYMLGVLAKTTEVVTVEHRLSRIEEMMKGGPHGLEPPK